MKCLEGSVLANRSRSDRKQSDYYPTPKEVTIALLNFLKIPKGTSIWEPACGKGHISKILLEKGYAVTSTDIENTGYGNGDVNFLETIKYECDWIITNPPFSLSNEFVEHCIELGKPFALVCKSQFWHSKKRLELFEKWKPRYVLPLTWRPDFDFGAKGGSPTMEVIWTVWIPQEEITEYIPLEKPNVSSK